MVLLAANAPEARAWVRRGVVPCHVLAHPAWAVVAPASTASEAGAPYDDALTLLAARHIGHKLAPAVGLFTIEDAAVLTARGSGRGPTRWALRGASRQVLAGEGLPPLSPEGLHRVLGSVDGGRSRPVPLTRVHELWQRTDLPHLEWLLEAMALLGLPGSQVLAGTGGDLGPRIEPEVGSVAAFESVVKDVHQ